MPWKPVTMSMYLETKSNYTPDSVKYMYVQNVYTLISLYMLHLHDIISGIDVHHPSLGLLHR